jgi:hypothetical protein
MLGERRDLIKARLLRELRKAEAAGKAVHLTHFADSFRCSVAFLNVLRQELASEGLCQPGEQRRQRLIEERSVVPDLQERIAAVREAKDRLWAFGREDLRNLSTAELEKALPS